MTTQSTFTVDALKDYCKEGNLEKVKECFEIGLDDSLKEGIRGWKHILRAACKKGQVEVVKFLLEDDRFHPMQLDYDGNTMIEIAIAFGQNEIFELLLNDERVNLDFQPNNGVPLAILSCISDYKTFSYFYSRGFDVSSRIPPDNEVCPIHAVCYAEIPNIDVINTLLNDSNVDVNALDAKGRTPFYTACKLGKVKAVEIMLKHPKVDVTIKDLVGRSALAIACKKEDNIEVVELLLQDGRLSPVEDYEDLSPFHLAIERKSKTILPLLKDERVIPIVTDIQAKQCLLAFLKSSMFFFPEDDTEVAEIGYTLWKLGFDLQGLIEGETIPDLDSKMNAIKERVTKSTLGKSARTNK